MPGMYGPRDTRRQRLEQDIVSLLRGYTLEAEHLTHAFARRHQLHGTDLAALIAIMEAEGRGTPLTPGELSTRLRISTGATTAVIDRLERSQHIARSREHDDRRRVSLRYAETGMVLALAFFGPLGARSDDVMATFDDDELATVHRFMTGMTDAIAGHRATIDGGTPA